MRQLGLADICVHQVCLSEQTDFAGSLEMLARHGIGLTALWQPMLAETGLRRARKLLSDSAVRPVSLCAAQLFAGQAACLSMLEAAAELGAESVVVITGGFDAADKTLDQARDQGEAALARLAEAAADFPVRLALEPLHPMVCGFRSVLSSLAEANTLLDRLDQAVPQHKVGLAVDAYALWWETDIARQIDRAGNRILNYHISDWLADTQDIRLDRGMPGDGVIDLLGWRQMIEQTGFAGPVEIEIFSARNWWQRPAEEMLHAIIAGMNRVY
jgi:sugar phosphate isomerase/epimerase